MSDCCIVVEFHQSSLATSRARLSSLKFNDVSVYDTLLLDCLDGKIDFF